MATSGRIPTLGFGVATGAVVLLGFGSWGSAGGGRVVSARAYASNVVSVRAFRPPQIADGIAYSANVQRGRGYVANVVSADGFSINRASGRAINTEPSDAGE